MDAHIKHLLRSINAEADRSGDRGEQKSSPVDDAVLELLDAYSRTVISMGNPFGFQSTVSTLADKRKINPFLRFNDASIISILKAKGLPTATEQERWESVMSLP